MIFNKIWVPDFEGKDLYADFFAKFNAIGKKTVLKITCDNAFCVCINGKTAAFGNCTDFPEHPEFYEFDITEYCKAENDITITVHHEGESNQSYCPDEAFLAFEISADGEVLLKSDESILCRVNPNYKSGYCKRVTSQYGFGFYYDATAKSIKPLIPVIIKGELNAVKRIAKNEILCARVDAKITEKDYGVIIELPREEAGLFTIDVESDEEKELVVCFGERLLGGKVLSKVRDADYSTTVKLKRGRNKFTYPFRRIACKYLATDDKSVKINYIGIRPVNYPVEEVKRKFDDELFQKIYDVGVHTLKCCMHEHYEDCPMREQGLYIFDARNQMLCGYYAFNNPEFPKSNLILISQGLSKYGLFRLTFPSAVDYPIPFFSLVYPVAVAEYVEHTGDFSITEIVGDKIKTMMNSFKSKIRANGLIPRFSRPCWNFYEWTKFSDGDDIWIDSDLDNENIYELILNCAYVLAVKACDKLFNTATDTAKTVEAIKKVFYVKEKGEFKLSTCGDNFSQLGNAIACLAGAGDEGVIDKLITDKNLIPVTLSSSIYFYDALLLLGDKYKDFVIDDIRKKYSFMLNKGATTFWEVENVEDNPCWSLCHGWSAMPVYYLSKLVKNEVNL